MSSCLEGKSDEVTTILNLLLLYLDDPAKILWWPNETSFRLTKGHKPEMQIFVENLVQDLILNFGIFGF
jgi:hypothetical protein